MGRRDEIDEAVARRIAEISAAAGVPHSRASLEVLYYLPTDFLAKYSELFNSCLRLDSGGVGGSPEEQPARVSGVWKGKLPGVTGGGKRYKEFWIVRDDDLLELKKRVDKRLRAIGREIGVDLKASTEDKGQGDELHGRVRCTRCGRIMARDWNFCAQCGNHKPVGGE